MAFLEAGTQQGHREDMSSCAAIPSNLYSIVHSVDPPLFSLYLPLVSPMVLNLSLSVVPSQIIQIPLYKSCKEIPCAQVFIAGLTPGLDICLDIRKHFFTKSVVECWNSSLERWLMPHDCPCLKKKHSDNGLHKRF